jgi:hypothetical protein
LGEFVQTSFPQELTNGCKALSVGEKIVIGIAFIRHSAKFVESEDATIFAWAGLGEKDWAAHADVDGDRNDQQEWGEEEKGDRGYKSISNPFKHFM